MKNSEFIVEQHRAGRLVRTFAPSGDAKLPWEMRVSGKVYLRTHGWGLSKILPTLLDGSPVTTKAFPATAAVSEREQ